MNCYVNSLLSMLYRNPIVLSLALNEHPHTMHPCKLFQHKMALIVLSLSFYYRPRWILYLMLLLLGLCHCQPYSYIITHIIVLPPPPARWWMTSKATTAVPSTTRMDRGRCSSAGSDRPSGARGAGSPPTPAATRPLNSSRYAYRAKQKNINK